MFSFHLVFFSVFCCCWLNRFWIHVHIASELEANLSLFVFCCRWCKNDHLWSEIFQKFNILRAIVFFLFSHFIYKSKKTVYFVLVATIYGLDGCERCEKWWERYFIVACFEQLFKLPNHTHTHTKRHNTFQRTDSIVITKFVAILKKSWSALEQSKKQKMAIKTHFN